jgi:nicotinate-nucleotide adenylyltransferase
MAQAVADALGLKQVRWIVTGDPEHKPVLASAEHRLQMVQAALMELNDPRMQADDREIIAAAEKQSNFTADTVAGLKQEFPQTSFIWILGEDQLEHFTTWARWQWLVKNIPFAVCARPGAQSASTLEKIQAEGGQLNWISIVPDAVSSTEIRSQIRSGQLQSGLVPQSVARYIAEHQLYQQ